MGLCWATLILHGLESVCSGQLQTSGLNEFVVGDLDSPLLWMSLYWVTLITHGLEWVCGGQHWSSIILCESITLSESVVGNLLSLWISLWCANLLGLEWVCAGQLWSSMMLNESVVGNYWSSMIWNESVVGNFKPPRAWTSPWWATLILQDL
jgi:hypothetical protein